jgi:hypothetical protein
LERFGERAGLSLPRLEYKTGLAQGHAYGLKGSEALLLSGSPDFLEETWKVSSRAIALHELAHVADGDAQEREKARAVWASLLILLALFAARIMFAQIPVAGVLIRDPRTSLFMLQLLSMLVLVRWIAAELIRQREFHADWRAASWGAGPALERYLQLQESEAGWWESSRCWWQAWGRWGERWWWRAAGRIWDGVGRKLWRLWRLHPSFAARRGMLADPSKLFRISASMPWLTGAVLGFALGSALWGLMDLFYFLSDATDLIATAAVQRLLRYCFLGGIAYLLTKAMGIQVQREAVADLMPGAGRGWGYAGLARPALALAGGMEAGLFMAPLSVFTPRNSEGLAIVPLSFAILAFLFWLWLAYIHGSARLLLGSYVGRAKPGRRRAIVTLTSALLLAILLWPAALFQLTVGFALMLEAESTYPQALMKQQYIREIPRTFSSLFIALMICLGWVCVCLVLSWVGVLRKRKRCLSCGEESPFRLVLGRSCLGCGGSLSAWVFAPDLTENSSRGNQVTIGSRSVGRKEARRENRATAIEIIGLLLFLVGLVPLFLGVVLMASVLLEKLAPGVAPRNLADLTFQREVGAVGLLTFELAFLVPAAALMSAGTGLRRHFHG